MGGSCLSGDVACVHVHCAGAVSQPVCMCDPPLTWLRHSSSSTACVVPGVVLTRGRSLNAECRAVFCSLLCILVSLALSAVRDNSGHSQVSDVHLTARLHRSSAEQYTESDSKGY